ncbi:TetR/AcrR family transcriptional regulator [Streptococcus suis]|uniref:TetR/AcrR family transcriptional regulator n=1 Tax=Streptococcus TaxID=1301 RepID=UPI000418462E|nr:TetR/AcrR family transcriptional regulator [Streptococcus suis]
MNNQDLRVIKTKENIISSFVILLGDKSFEKITIQDILDRSLINRSTFYRHFNDKYDLAKQINNQLIQQIQTLLKTRFGQKNSYEHLSKEMNLEFHQLLTKREVFLAMISIQNNEINLKNELLKIIEEHYIRYLGKDALESQLFAALVLTTLTYRIQQNQVLSLEDIKETMLGLINSLKHTD